MDDCSAKQLCFPPLAGQTVRADFEGGALSSDFGALLLRGVDRRIGLTERLAAAIHDKRHPSSIDHPLRDLLAQRIFKSLRGMQTPMTPTVSAMTRGSNWAWSGAPWTRRKTWRVPPRSRVLSIRWTARTSIVSPAPWWPTSSPAMPRLLPLL